MRLANLLHDCIYSLLKRPAVQRASKVITSHILLACTFLVVLWKRVAVTFVEVSLVLGFCCWLTPITLTVLCVSTCSDGLLDFHTGAAVSVLLLPLPRSPPFRDVLGRPFRAVRGTIG